LKSVGRTHCNLTRPRQRPRYKNTFGLMTYHAPSLRWRPCYLTRKRATNSLTSLRKLTNNERWPSGCPKELIHTLRYLGVENLQFPFAQGSCLHLSSYWPFCGCPRRAQPNHRHPRGESCR